MVTDVAHAVSTELVSISSTGEHANGESYRPSISGDGRFVVFESGATNLVPGFAGGAWHGIFVRDRLTRTTEIASVSTTGEPAGGCYDASVNADGRFVAFASPSSNLVPGDTGWSDVFVRDRLNGTTERVSVSSTGQQGNGPSGSTSISADGRFVAFTSDATNLVPGDTNGCTDIFVHDRLTHITERVSISSAGEQNNADSLSPTISGDGRFVSFPSVGSTLVPGDTNRRAPSDYSSGMDVFVHDRQTGTTERVSVSSTGTQAQRPCYGAAINASGRFVAFSSDDEFLAPGPAGWRDVYVRDRQTATTQRVSLSSSGQPSPGQCGQVSISADGRFVAFDADSWLLVPNDQNDVTDVFVHDRATGITEIVSVGAAGEQGNYFSFSPAISADGRCVAFLSWASNLVPQDTDRSQDVLLRDRGPVQPVGPMIIINSGQGCTNSTTVTLTLVFPEGYNEMRLRNDPGNWPWYAWQPAIRNKPWLLPSSDGVKRVCMQCRDASGTVSPAVCDDILLDATPPSNLSVVINGGAECTSTSDFDLTISATGATEISVETPMGFWLWEPYHTSSGWSWRPSKPGVQTIRVAFRDDCGNLVFASDDIWVAVFSDLGCSNPLLSLS
jgi:Tol biopolymer transport system component